LSEKRKLIARVLENGRNGVSRRGHFLFTPLKFVSVTVQTATRLVDNLCPKLAAAPTNERNL
jgi:hypothetical protein